MKTKISSFLTTLILALLSTLNSQLSTAHAQGTAFTYQGRLNFNGAPAAGNFDVRFAVFDANTNGNQFGVTLTNSATAVTNGLFAVTLDFGAGIFTGPSRWLEIAARTNGNGAFATLTPRQALTPTPYAFYSATTGNASTAVNANNFTGSLAGDVTGSQASTVVASVGGQTATNVASGASAANAATSANVVNTIVKRNGSGNFSAGAISAASVSGDGSGLTNLNGGNISIGTITGSQLAPGAVTSANIASNSITAGQLAAGAAAANLNASGQSGVASGGAILSANPNSATLTSAGYSLLGTTILPDFWQLRNGVNAPSPRSNPSGVWSGTEFIVWGGLVGGTYVTTNYLNDGGRYNPASNSWTATSLVNAPTKRFYHTAVWTGTNMIVWGGVGSSTNLNTGGVYNPANDSWSATSLIGAPTARRFHTAVWTGTEMIVWGGDDFAGTLLNTGGKYNPSNNTWTAISTVGAPSSRIYHSAVWTGTEMIIYGGVINIASLPFPTDVSVYRYNPASNTWTQGSLIYAPTGRAAHTAIWTGTEMIVWGGFNNTGALLNDGARYNPQAFWTPLSTGGAPAARENAPAVWTGSTMIVANGDPGGVMALADGGQFSVSLNSWNPTTLIGAAPARVLHAAVWDGNEMLVFGGAVSGANVLPVPASMNDLWSYTPSRTLYIYSKP